MLSCSRCLFPPVLEEEYRLVEFQFRDENHGALDKGGVIFENSPRPVRGLLGRSAIFVSVLIHSTHKSMSRATEKRWKSALTRAIVLELE